MPTKFAVALVVAVALFVVVGNRQENKPADEATSSVGQGLEQVDSVLQQGLSGDTHGKISDSLSNSFSESAKFLGVPDLSD